MSNELFGKRPIPSTAITGSGEALLEVLGMGRADGILSAELVITGAGTIAVDILGSIGGTNYLMGENKQPMATGLSAASGEDADGNILIESDQDSLPATPLVRLRVRETAGSGVTISGYMAVR